MSKSPTVLRTPTLSLRFVCRKTQDKSGFSVVVSKSTLKHAVDRNRLRRRLYEILRIYIPTLTVGLKGIVYVRAAKPFTSLRADLLTLLHGAEKRCS